MGMEIRNQRDIETILTEEWNDAIGELESASKVISWEYDGSAALLQTKLVDLEKSDPEFVDVVKARQRVQGQD